MSKAAHTPTPWHIMYPKAFDYKIVESIRDREICRIDGTYPEFDQCEEHEDRHHADAKLIVTAVNHHQELVTRLHNLVNAIESIQADGDNPIAYENLEHWKNEARETLKKVIQ